MLPLRSDNRTIVRYRTTLKSLEEDSSILVRFQIRGYDWKVKCSKEGKIEATDQSKTNEQADRNCRQELICHLPLFSGPPAPHTCSVCDKSLAETGTLKKHQLIHALGLYLLGKVRFHLAICYDNGSICSEKACIVGT